MKVKHTQNGNVKLTVTLEQAKVIDWALTYIQNHNVDGYFNPDEVQSAAEMVSVMDSNDLY